MDRARTGCRAGAGLSAAAAALVLTGCGLFRGAVNSSPGLRWWIFSHFGAEKMCPEMLKRGAPLQLVPGGDTLGRFFPNACRTEVNDGQQTVTIHFAGTGYAWTPVAGRVGFSMGASVEYRPDFQLTSDAMYVWAQVNRVVAGPTFAIGSVENKLADWAARSPAGYLASTFGSQIVQSQLASGFTVVRTDHGDEFSLGHLTPPARPVRAFDLGSEDRVVLANETTDVRPGQVDFLGPVEVTESGQALFLTLALNGPAVDVLVLGRAQADPWRESLQLGAPLGAPAYPPVATFVVQPGPSKQRLRLPPGQYYLVIDNSNSVGAVAPPWSPLSVLGGGAAVLACSVELGEAD
jgi:hypothetical protein